jgi:class 3 adenylate cyclase/pimeloyl-ACP methyl ester carboxylesterase
MLLNGSGANPEASSALMVRTQGDGRQTAMATVLFCDLVGSTERQTRVGDDASDEFRRAFFEVLGDAVQASRGEIVKNTGDGLMVVFRESIADAVSCASVMHDRVESLDAEDPARLRIGVSAGEVAKEDGDWFGTPVVEAARLCAAARSGQTLVSEVVPRLVGSRGGHQFKSVGALTLKGLPAPIAAATLTRTPVVVRARRKPRRRQRSLLVVVTAAGVVSAGLVIGLVLAPSSPTPRALPAPVGYVPRFEAASCPSDFLKLVPNGTCEDLVVPEDRTRPGHRWLPLLVTRAPARTSSPAPDPTIALDSSAEDPATSPARDHADLISISTRISQDPNPAMACPEFEAVRSELLTLPRHDPTAIALGQRALAACHDRLVKSGVALDHYTYEDAGNDVLDLIRVLHLTSVNLVGVEDSSVVALAVVRDAPYVVRTLTLQNPWPTGSGWWDPTKNLAAAFDRYVGLCRANPQCATAYPDLPGLARKDWAALNAHPQIVTATDPNTGTQRPILVNGDTAAQALANTLGSDQGDPLIAAAIANPPLNLLAGAALIWDLGPGVPNFPWAAHLSKACSWAIYQLSSGHSISSTARPELAGVDDGFYEWACATWRVPRAPATAFAGAASTVPTLLVVGQLDSVQAPESPALLAGSLPNASVLRLPTLGAGALNEGRPPCLDAVRRTLLADPTGRLNVENCSKLSPPITFVASTP